MPVHRQALMFALMTLLGLIAVTLQIRGVQLGYRVTREEARLARLREYVREAEIAVHRRRDLTELWQRCRALNDDLDKPAAGRVLHVVGRGIVMGEPAARRPADADAGRARAGR
jgi:hypothetical protein